MSFIGGELQLGKVTWAGVDALRPRLGQPQIYLHRINSKLRARPSGLREELTHEDIDVGLNSEGSRLAIKVSLQL